MRATSRRRICEPSVRVRSRMLLNSSAVRKRVWAVMVALICCSPTAGKPPSWPADTWAFWAWMALLTSSGVRLKLISLSGLSHTRMAYCEPNKVVSPTPSTRLSASCTLAAT